MQLHTRFDRLPALLALSQLGQMTVNEAQAATETQAETQAQRQPNTPLLVGVDLGGTQTRAAVVREHEIVARVSHPTPAAEGPAAVIAVIVKAIHEALELAEVGLSDIGGIGISAPGPLDPVAGIVYEAPNLRGWENVPLRDEVQRQFNGALPVFLGHDATLAGLAEHLYGAGRGTHDMIYMTVSTGIGGGIIIGNTIVDGTSGTAGEIGHMYLSMSPDAPRCGIGHVGCLEAFASGTAIARDANALIASGGGQAILRAHQAYLAQHPPQGDQSPAPAVEAAPRVSARDVAQAAEEGDPEAHALFQQAGTAIGFGCTNLIHALNPEAIVIGGSLINAGPLLFEPILQTVQARAFQRPAEMTRIVPAQLGDDGGLIGAAAYVRYRQQRA